MTELVALLTEAYSAENAATLAYIGHAGSVKNPLEKVEISKIVDEEIKHRQNVLRMLKTLQIQPSGYLEMKYKLIGNFIRFSCYVIGWFMPMYFAGRLESKNVKEYMRMAELAKGTEIENEIACILEMAKTEKEHEIYFLNKIRTHSWISFFQSLFGWGPEQSFNKYSAADFNICENVISK